jgi:hypothetical protein
MKDSFLKEVRERRARDLASLEKLNAQIQELQAEATLFDNTLRAYDEVLGTSSTRKRGRPPGSTKAAKKSRGPRGSTKTSAVIDIIAKQGDKGASPGEIFENVQNMGVKDFTKNYVYTVLHKLKGRNKLKEKGGRYFLPKQASSR